MMIKPISTVRQALRRLDAAIADEASPRNRAMLEIFRKHWWGEVTNDLHMIMATLPAEHVHYRFDGHPLVMGEKVEFHTTAEARAMYQRVIDAGDHIAGSFDDERWAFGDWGLMFEATLHGLYHGSLFADRIPGLDSEGLYLISYRSVSLHPMDKEARQMLGEIVYSGSPLGFEAVGADTLATVFDI